MYPIKTGRFVMNLAGASGWNWETGIRQSTHIDAEMY